MKISDKLLADETQSKEVALSVADFACESEENFQELMECFVSVDYTLAKRAAWSVRWASQNRPDLLLPHIDLLVKQLKRTDVHDAVIRNSVSILEKMTIPDAFHGEVMDACFAFIQNRKTAIAPKAFSLTILFNLSKIYPEIKNELRILIEENMPFETAAFVSRGSKILAVLRKG